MPKGHYPTPPKSNRRNWTEWEIIILQELAESGWTDQRIARYLLRTQQSVAVKRKRIRIPHANKQGYSLRGLGRLLFGVDASKQIRRWINAGWLRARRIRSGYWGPHGRWFVTQDDLLEFLANPQHQHLWSVDRITDARIKEMAELVIEDRMLTTGEAAKRLNVEPATVRHWCAWGWIKSRKNGRRLIPESALAGFEVPGDRYAANRKAKAAPSADTAPQAPGPSAGSPPSS